VAIAPTTATILVWNGSQSSDWNTQANWTPNNDPAGFGIMIPDHSSAPNIPVFTRWGACKSVQIETNGILNCASGATISLTGENSVWNCESGGVFHAGNSIVTFSNATEIQAYSGSTDFYNIVLSSGTVLIMSANSRIGIAGVITNNGTLRTVFGGENTTVEYEGADQTVVIPNVSTNRY